MPDETDGDSYLISIDGLIILLEVQYGVRVSIHEGSRDGFSARAVSKSWNQWIDMQARGSTVEEALDRLEGILKGNSENAGSRLAVE